MKKMICAILAGVMMLSCAACGGNGGSEEEGKDPSAFTPGEAGVLMAGYGRTVISPKQSLPLGGYGNGDQRFSERVLDDLMATCVAFTEGDQAFLLISTDAVRAKQEWTDAIRARIETELNVPGTNVMVMASHSHSAPETNSNDPALLAYVEVYVNGCVEAAKAALADLAKATVSAGSVQTASMTFVRHYEMNDGTVSGPNFGSAVSGYKGHVGRGDEGMILWKVEREGDKKPILMMNFQAHTTLTGGAEVKDISADYVGVCRDYLEDNADVLFAYYLGACGNQTPNSYIGIENNTMPFAGQLPSSDRDVYSYGTALALYAMEAMPSLTPVDMTGGIKTSQKVVTCPTHKTADETLLAEAMEVKAEWEKNGRDAGNALARQYGFASVYEANGIIGQQNLPESRDIQVCATRVGGLYFVNAPYEMFSENSLYIKENSPANTMVMTQSNHAWGYITDMKAHEYKCYENFGGTFAPGCGEKLVEEMVGLLKGLQ